MIKHRAIGLAAAATAALVVIGAGVATSAPNAPQAPPGNNGTIKIDGTPFDSHNDNEPHVGCVFQVKWYGYDKGNLYSSVLFSSQSPTPPGPNQQTLLFDPQVFIGEDSNAGGGSEAGLDATKVYDLTSALAGITPTNQGWHVKLTIHADGSQGADVKHKVFWVSGCNVPTTTTTTSTTTSSTTSTTAPSTTTTTAPSTTTTTAPSTTTTTAPSTTTTTAPSSTTTTAPSTTTAPPTTAPPTTAPPTTGPPTTHGQVTTTVPGVVVPSTQPPTPPQPGVVPAQPKTPNQLAFTGRDTKPYLVVGLALLGAGAVLALTAHKRLRNAS